MEYEFTKKEERIRKNWLAAAIGFFFFIPAVGFICAIACSFEYWGLVLYLYPPLIGFAGFFFWLFWQCGFDTPGRKLLSVIIIGIPYLFYRMSYIFTDMNLLIGVQVALSIWLWVATLLIWKLNGNIRMKRKLATAEKGN